MNLQIDTELQEPLSDLGRLLIAFGPYRSQFVVVGGMVPVIYRHFKNASPVPQKPLTTFDIDVASPEKLVTAPGPDLDDLILQSDFFDYRRGSTDPQTTVYQHVRHGTELKTVYVELLAPLVWSDSDRHGIKKVQTEIRPGVTAQLIRYLDLLQISPINVNASSIPSLNIHDVDVDFCVPNPGMYIVQKVLCRKKRRSDKKDKDLAYVYDVALLFREDWEQIAVQVEQAAQTGAKYENWINDALRQLTSLFATPTSDGPVAVVREISTAATGVTPTENAVHQVINSFLDAANLRRWIGDSSELMEVPKKCQTYLPSGSFQYIPVPFNVKNIPTKKIEILIS